MKIQSARRIKGNQGFTIVELIVVIVVIAILASITTLAFGGIQGQARDTAIISDLKNFATSMEVFRINNNEYPYPNNDSLSRLNYSVTQSAYPGNIDWHFDYCPNVARNEYVLATYLNSGEIVYVSSNNSTPDKYDASDVHDPTNRTASPCYSGTAFSAADRAGVGQIGILNGEGTVIDNGGYSGKTATGWRSWATSNGS